MCDDRVVPFLVASSACWFLIISRRETLANEGPFTQPEKVARVGALRLVAV